MLLRSKRVSSDRGSFHNSFQLRSFRILPIPKMPKKGEIPTAQARDEKRDDDQR